MSRSSFSLLLVMVGAPALGFGQSGNGLRVGPPIHVSTGHPDLKHSEVMIAADPEDPTRLLATSHVQGSKGLTMTVYLSTDGGRSWRITLDSLANCDPAVAFGPHHTAYFTSLDGKIYRSTNGGETWDFQPYMGNVGAPAGKFSFDREYLVADLNPSSRHYGTMYMNGTTFLSPENVPQGTYLKSVSALALYTSRDGQNFGVPILRPVFEPYWIIGMANSVVLSSGRVVTLFGIRNDSIIMAKPDPSAPINATINVAIAEAGGTDILKQVRISDWQMGMPNGVRSGFPSSLIPWLAVDPGSAAFGDRLYAVWADGRSHRSRVYLSFSADSGMTWTQPFEIDDPQDGSPEGPDALVPMVAVNRDGVVLASWYSRAMVDGKYRWEMRATASFDGGDTWLPSTVFASEMLAPESDTTGVSTWAWGGGNGVISLTASLEPNDIFTGDTGGLTADATGVFHPLWADGRTGLQQLFTTEITASGTVARHGSPDLAGLMDLGGALQLRIGKTVHDRAARRVTFVGKLMNTSADTIRGPVKIRILGATSAYGPVTILGASNGMTGAGAVIDVAGAVPAPGLAAGEESAEVRITVELGGLTVIPEGPSERGPFINIRARLLGPQQTIRKKAEK